MPHTLYREIVPYNLAPLLELTDDDMNFRQELVASYVASFEAFPEDFANLVTDCNEVAIRFAVHRIKASVRMIEATEFERLLNDVASHLTTADTRAKFNTLVLQQCQVICYALLTQVPLYPK